MIIGNNNIGKQGFISNNKQMQEKINENNMNKQRPIVSPMNEKASTMIHTDVMNKNDMHNKSFAMLQERLNNGTISIDEFNRKCIELGKHSK